MVGWTPLLVRPRKAEALNEIDVFTQIADRFEARRHEPINEGPICESLFLVCVSATHVQVERFDEFASSMEVSTYQLAAISAMNLNLATR